jgi:hypothetical protein
MKNKINLNLKCCLILLVISTSALSQEIVKKEDSIIKKDTPNLAKEHKLTFTVDLVNRYIWRGQSWGGNYSVIQPTIEYSPSENWTFGIWGTTNFKKDYFYPDNETSYKGYHEIDLYLSKKITKYLRLELWDYYWPSVSKVDDVSNQLFNFSSNSVNTIATDFKFDFNNFKIPLEATLSTFIAGNDFKYDENGENPKQNFTTYLELVYKYEIFNTIELKPCIGAVINNQAQYYTAGDYNKTSFVNISLKALKKIKLKNSFEMPISLNFTHNAATKNTEIFGRNFILVGLSIKRK